MTKLEKSVRHALAPYGPGLRAGWWAYPGQTGFVTKRGVLASAFCDVLNGEVVDIRLYGFQDAKELRDHAGQSTDISKAFCNVGAPSSEPPGFLMDRNWNELIMNIVSLIRNESVADEEGD